MMISVFDKVMLYMVWTNLFYIIIYYHISNLIFETWDPFSVV